jgi:hypothetical protein
MGVTSDGSDPVCLAVAQSALIQDGSRVSQGMVLFSADFLELRVDMLVAKQGWVTNPGIPISGVLIKQGGMTTAIGVLQRSPIEPSAWERTSPANVTGGKIHQVRPERVRVCSAVKTVTEAHNQRELLK